MEMIKNNKGGQKLCYDGYMYTKKSVNKTSIRWECSRRKAMKCSATLYTDLDISIEIKGTKHSHNSNTAKVDATKARVQMNEHASATRGKPSQIIADTVVNLPVAARAEIGNSESVKRTIRNHKRHALPKDPACLQDLKLDDSWTMVDGQEFMFYDSGADSSRRVIVFATEEGLRYLTRSTQWFMDGTFRTAPKLFHQLYLIRCPLGESKITCVYAFLSGKTQSIYEEVFQAIVEQCATLGFNLDPTTITTDFELATVNAIRTVFGDHVQCHDCLFFFT
ncbi:uncharacterized protein LOC143030340 [Oratosquilla oratoria]|uniref:uncharacterized protein LOC143030340 n=1 Tax=Oratosquilla oratoria TaxID=337810 RepID=UPI003F7586B3